MADEEHTRKPRTVCPVCGKSVAARNDGTARHHYPPGAGEPVWCAGGSR